MRKILLFLLLALVIAVLVFSKPRPVKKESGDSGYKIEDVVSGLNVPWSLAFTGEDRLLIAERRGQIRIVEKGKLSEKPLFVFGNIYNQEEAGLMGLTVDPDYQVNKYLYAAYAYNQNGKPRIKVVRLIDKGESATVERTLLENILAAPFHDGSRIKFGPDGKLYVTTGEATQKNLAQKLDSLNGKILRINSDGTIPADNPFPNSPVYSYGHRNPQGIAWSPTSGLLWETEHGPSGFDGPGGGDEVNVIRAGLNYGWPEAYHEIKLSGTEYPKLLFTPAIAPAGATFYGGELLPDFKNNLFFAGLKGEGVWRAIISATNPEKIESYEKLSSIKVGRIRDVVEGPDGAIYFSTSNRDGRGTSRNGDDKVYRIVPSEQ